jgi:hypothetical protein
MSENLMLRQAFKSVAQVLLKLDSQLGGYVNKTISPRLLNDPQVSPLLRHKIQIFSQSFQCNPFRIKYASELT